ncbi:MAG: glycine cleavage system protein GcvH [Verrucomicrobia bacterium]|nr:glycine cleavage system protein GcvH [Verrucomicrobiota bacterium]
MHFSTSHEWVSISGKIGTVGITDHAQKELGAIVYVELPKVGDTVLAGEEVSVLESTKAAADIYSPVSGRVTAINEEVKTTPSLLNQHPESSAWLYKIELSKPKEVDRLMSRDQYLATIS